MTTKKVSIIVPVYNVESFLPQCLDSIIRQTHHNLEIILVDDGSRDQSGKICDEYARLDKRIRVIHQENSGLSAARNAGLDIASGAYIAFIDSDDWISPRYVELLLCEDDPTALSLCNLNIWTSEDDNHPLMSIAPTEIIDTEEFWKRTTGKDITPYIIACSKLYPASVFQNVRFQPGLFHEDEAILHEVIDQIEKIHIIYEPLYFYRQRETSIMGQKFNPRRLDAFVGWANRLAYFRSKRYRSHEDAIALKYWDRYKDQIFAISEKDDPEDHRSRAIRSYSVAFPSLMRARTISLSQKVSVLVMRISPDCFRHMWQIVEFLYKIKRKKHE